MKKILLGLTLITTAWLQAQNNSCYWQQHVDYKMDVDIDAANFQYSGEQVLEYTNNSPDTLKRVFYHMYPNAFKPGSDMDVRSRTIKDPDGRVGSRIASLSPDKQGFLKASSLTQNGKPLQFKEVGTVLEVSLEEPILPGDKVTFEMEFKGQVPEQIRRSGRNNKEGVALSMTQWFPKLAEYDFQGWHADSYIGREFHGVWGDFDVKLKIDKKYTVAATGVLQNADEIGHGYSDKKVKSTKEKKHTWHFKAKMVHDFAWAADPEYVHDKRTAKDGTVLHFFYKDDKDLKENWTNLQSKTEELLLYFNENIGPYPWEQYSIVQGGDGGMEYANLTLITGNRSFGSLVGVTSHELAHAWFQHLLATNESKHEWMDEGFTSFISNKAMNEVMQTYAENPQAGSYAGYMQLAKSGVEQPQTTHADRYQYNGVYGAAAYSKGSVFLAQLEYIIGQENLNAVLKRYYDEWKFKHPTPNDFIRVAEKVSGAELDWYLMDWTQTTNTIDYGITSVENNENTTSVSLERIGLMPMPIEVKVSYTNGEEEVLYIPLEMMRWEKPSSSENWKTVSDWSWANPTYTLNIEKPLSEISEIEIDSSSLMADIDRSNNIYKVEAPIKQD